MPILEEVLSRVADDQLSGYGFRILSEESNELVRAYARKVGKEQHYVRIAISWDLRDKPWQVLASIGEGSLIMPERDWNGYPLWMLARAHGANPSYGYESVEDLEEVVERVANDLLTHAEPFLRGDLAEFRRARAELNESREPYRVIRTEQAPDDPSRYD